MHPRTFLDAFWRNDLRDEVFVATSLAPTYESRWTSILVPAIEHEPVNGINLKAKRVDLEKSGDSILTAIVDGISHAQLIVADISVTHVWNDDGCERPERNGNVMYEVGLAIAVRQPVEVVLIRDDNAPLLFDVSSIPVLEFDPSDAAESVTKIRAVLADRLVERDLNKDLRVTRAMESLSPFELNIIRQNPGKDHLAWKGGGLSPAVSMGLPGLLEKRILRRVDSKNEEYPHTYTYTTFGKIVAEKLWTAVKP